MSSVERIDRAVCAAVARFGRSALAWEVLRRDPGYRSAFDTAKNWHLSGIDGDSAFVARWGLHFP